MKTTLLPPRPAAFTLVELVISSALMSIILGVAYGCFSAGLSGQRMVEARADIAQNARVAMAHLTADLRSATPLSAEFEFLGMDRMMGDAEADNVDFGTHHFTPKGPREGDFCEVSYFLEKAGASRDFTLWRRRDPTPDADRLAGGSREEIAEGLRGFRLEYYDGFEWFDEWGDPEGRRRGQAAELLASNTDGLPEAVRITLRFAADSLPRTEDASSNVKSEPMLTFQTVVRLDLASIVWSRSRRIAGSDSANPSTGTTPAVQRGGSN